MQRSKTLRAYLACSTAATLILFAMPREAERYSTEPAMLLEQLDGTEIPNPVFDDLLTIAGKALAIVINMVPGF